jgi:hypothetical protein
MEDLPHQTELKPKSELQRPEGGSEEKKRNPSKQLLRGNAEEKNTEKQKKESKVSR